MSCALTFRFLFPPLPASLTEVMFFQDENFARRRKGPLDICNNEYGNISIWYTVRQGLKVLIVSLKPFYTTYCIVGLKQVNLSQYVIQSVSSVTYHILKHTLNMEN